MDQFKVTLPKTIVYLVSGDPAFELALLGGLLLLAALTCALARDDNICGFLRASKLGLTNITLFITFFVLSLLYPAARAALPNFTIAIDLLYGFTELLFVYLYVLGCLLEIAARALGAAVHYSLLAVGGGMGLGLPALGLGVPFEMVLAAAILLPALYLLARSLPPFIANTAAGLAGIVDCFRTWRFRSRF